MVMNSTPAKIVLAVLAVIGGLMMLSAFGMFYMHSGMTGGSAFHGLWSSMGGMCRRMMGS